MEKVNMENGIEENNRQQQLLDALKALRECKEVSDLSEEQRNALTNASANDLYNAYIQIDTFDIGKCCSFENPCCAYGLCSAGVLTSAILCATVMPRLCATITPYQGNSIGGGYLHGKGVGTVVGGISNILLLPTVGGVNALVEYSQLERKKSELANDRQLISSSDDFLPTLKRIISFHSYSETDRKNIEQAIKNLCRRLLMIQMNLSENYDAPTEYSNSNNNISEHNTHTLNSTEEIIMV